MLEMSLRIMRTKKMEKNKRGMAIENLTPWLIALAILAIIVIFSILLKDKLVDMAIYIKNLFAGKNG